MFYIFYGENDYLIKQTINKLSQGFSEAKTLDFSDLTREISEVKSLPDILSQQSLFAQKILFVLQGFLKNTSKEELDKLLAFLQSVPKNNDINLVFWEEKLDQRLKITKWLKENAQVKEFGDLRKPEVRKWIGETVSRLVGESVSQVKNAKAVQPSAIEELIRLHDSNLWALENEIKKLVVYTQGREITIEDVKKLCAPSVEDNIFGFTDAVAVRDKKKSAELFSNLLSQQQDVWYLFAMIVRQFRLLTLMKATGKLSKTHPFVVQKTSQQVKYWELGKLKEIYQKLLDIDLACKTGKGDMKTELSLLIAKL